MKGVICVVFMYLLLDVVLPDAAAATDQRLELTERDRVYPIVSKWLSIHVCLWSSLDLIKRVDQESRFNVQRGPGSRHTMVFMRETNGVTHPEMHIPNHSRRFYSILGVLNNQKGSINRTTREAGWRFLK